eukprot:gene13717-18399_t
MEVMLKDYSGLSKEMLHKHSLSSPIASECNSSFFTQSSSTNASDMNINLSVLKPKLSLDCYPPILLNNDVNNIDIESLGKISYLSHGGNSLVFTGRLQKKNIILKILHVDHSNTDNKDIENEINILSRISHDNIIGILGFGNQPRSFIILEKLQSECLSDRLKHNVRPKAWLMKCFHHPTFTFDESVRLATELSEAIQYLHFRFSPIITIIHRDIKPSNIGFTADGKLKLFDFGLAKCIRRHYFSNENFEMTGVTGSYPYMAPEVACNEPYNESVDVYSFGVVVHQMLTDKIPFEGSKKSQFKCKSFIIKNRPKIKNHWPNSLKELLESCLHENPSKRLNFNQIVNRLKSMRSHNVDFSSGYDSMNNPIDVIMEEIDYRL